MSAHVTGIKKNRIGFITLDRAKALNALSLDMVRTLAGLLRKWRHDDDVVEIGRAHV